MPLMEATPLTMAARREGEGGDRTYARDPASFRGDCWEHRQDPPDRPITKALARSPYLRRPPGVPVLQIRRLYAQGGGQLVAGYRFGAGDRHVQDRLEHAVHHAAGLD